MIMAMTVRVGVSAKDQAYGRYRLAVVGWYPVVRVVFTLVPVHVYGNRRQR